MKWAWPLLLLPVACTEQVRGIEVQVDVAAAPAPGALTSAGRALTLERAGLALGSVELLPCSNDAPAASPSGLQPTSLQLQHTEGSPTLLGAPALLSLAEAADGFTLGTLLPPAGEYCAVRLTFQPADDDAVGLREADDVGATLIARGEVEGARFLLRATATVQVDAALEPALTLSSAQPSATLEVSLAPQGSWLEGTSLRAGDEVDDARTALMALAAAARVKLRDVQ